VKLFKNSFILKLPSYINVYYYYPSLIFRYKNKLSYLKFNYKLIFFSTSNLCIIPVKNFYNIINFVFYFRKILYNLTKKIYKKLILIGIGYKVLQIKKIKNHISLLVFKIGFSHCFYLKMFCVNAYTIKQSKIFLKNNFLKKSLLICSFIKKLRNPNNYNNKGIFFYNQI